MTLGYDEPRPTREQYDDFFKEFKAGLERINIPGLSFMLYGSYARGEHDPGVSDIDGVLIFDDDVVIDKKYLKQVGRVLHEAVKGKTVPFQVTISDIATLRDGRFNSYDATFEEYFREQAQIVVGPDYRGEITYPKEIIPTQITAQFRLRKTRQGLLFAEHYRKEDEKELYRVFDKSVKAITSGVKYLLYMTNGRLEVPRYGTITALAETFPEVSREPLEEIRAVMKEVNGTRKIDALMQGTEETRQQRHDEIIRIWEDGTTMLEEIVRAYVRRVPKED